MSLTLSIPDFLSRFRAASQPRLPALERILARAERLDEAAARDFPGAWFGLSTHELAAAPLTRLADGGPPDDGYWLRADPVHLAADRDRLLLVPGTALHIRQEEAAALAESFSRLYAPEGWRLEALAADRWYLRGTRPLDVTTHDPKSLAGRGVLEFMPAGPDAALLKQLMNETQMLFHDHPVNRQREAAGEPAINSLWLWGGGRLPKARPRLAPRVLGGGPLLRGLASWSGLTCLPLPQHWSGIAPAEHYIVEFVAADLPGMERHWFAPLLRAVKRGSVPSLNIHLGGAGTYRLTPSAARRFWIRGRIAAGNES